MKITDLAILFIIIILPFNLIAGINSDITESMVFKTNETNHIFDSAVEDGASQLLEVAGSSLIESGGQKKLTINKEKAVEAFLNTLTISFGLLNNDNSRKMLDNFIPCIAIIDYDGYYIMNNQEFQPFGGDKLSKLVWNPKRLFCFDDKDGDYVYYFTLDDYVTVYDKGTKKFYKGSFEEVNEQLYDEKSYSSDILDSEESFNEIRKTTIIGSLESDIKRAINDHNKIAKNYGITYHFSLPAVKDSDWSKTVDDVGIIAFFQGMPLGVTREAVNIYAIGGARLVKAPRYYVETDSTGTKYYHKKENCTLRTEKDEPETFGSRKECAENGYYPCPECKP